MAIKMNYTVDIPEGPGDTETDQTGVIRECRRCQARFEVKALGSRDDHEACRYHPGRKVYRTNDYSCCNSSMPCSRGPHIFEDKESKVLHARRTFVTTDAISTATAPLDVAAFDCELVYTTAGLSLARLTVISGQREKVLDELVRPPGDLLDPITKYSGIKREDLDKAVLDLVAVRKAFGALIDSNTILVGHALENDLAAIRLVHPPDRLIDTIAVRTQHIAIDARSYTRIRVGCPIVNRCAISLRQSSESSSKVRACSLFAPHERRHGHTRLGSGRSRCSRSRPAQGAKVRCTRM